MKATKCVLCLNSIPPQKSVSDDDTEIDSAKINEKIDSSDNDSSKSLFPEFCKYFSITLPNGILKWDFNKELAPICNECQSTASKLVKVHEELKSLQKVLQETEKYVRNRISESQKFLTRCAVEDQRILAVRDLIVRPVLRVENIQVSPSYVCSAAVETKIDVESDADYAVSFDDDDDPLRLQTEQNEQGEFFNEDTDNSGVTGQIELQSDHEEKPDVGLEAETLTFEIDGELDHTKISFNPPRQRSPRKYVAEDPQPETDLILENCQTARIAHTADTEDTEVKVDDCYNNEKEYTDSDDSSNEFEDEDFFDKDVFLSDDSVTILDDYSKLGSEFRQTTAISNREHGPNEATETGTVTRQNHKAPFNLTKLGSNRWDYGGCEYTKVGEYFNCSSCENAKFHRQDKVTRHIREYHLGYYIRHCKVCGKTYTNSVSFYSHCSRSHRPNPSVTETETRPVICEFCGKEFKRVGLLRAHLKRMHIPEGELKLCDVCGKNFKASTDVNRHKRSVHARQQRVYCEQCGKGFFDTSRLKQHMFAHSEEKSFTCDICGQKLAYRTGLLRHKKLLHQAKSSVAGLNDTTDAARADDGSAGCAKT